MSQKLPTIQPPETLEVNFTYTSTSGEDQWVIVRASDSYEEMLTESCINLAPWLPTDWRARPRDFARELRNSRGDIIWAAIQPSIVVELVQVGRLLELRLRIHPSLDHEPRCIQGGIQAPDEQSPPYEANPRHQTVDGVVQEVLHRICNDDSATDSAPKPPVIQYAKGQLREPEFAPLDSKSDRSYGTPTSPMGKPAPGTSEVGESTGSVERTLRLSSVLVSGGKREAAIRALRSACHGFVPPQERAKLFLWLGQIGCEITEYTNAVSDTSSARDIFTALEDRAGRIECDIVLARIARERTGVTSGEDTKLTQLLGEAKRHGLQAVEIQILCEICRLACSGEEIREDVTSFVEQARAAADRLGDEWLKAESTRIAGMVSEAGGDFVSALQAYSNSRELYRGVMVLSPLSLVKEVEADIERMRVTLSRPPEKPKSRFRKFF